MNIAMLTNSYSPQVGGVARSVQLFSTKLRERGHRVLIAAPAYKNAPADEEDVVRIPSIRNFNDSDFSMVLPVTGLLTEQLDAFNPDIVHSHHPYLLGMTAVRIARYRELPLAFTHHTMYEHYTHYVPMGSKRLKRFVLELSIHYANLCDHVVAPSRSLADILMDRGVKAPIAVVPTGVKPNHASPADAAEFRKAAGIPADAFVVGHVGRLAPEKNLEFLARAVADFFKTESRARFFLAGEGPALAEITDVYSSHNLSDRMHIMGELPDDKLAAAYRAMDVFAFASKSETQGMVLTEAMAAGAPVLALDAPGVRDVVKDGRNGRLLREESVKAFSEALSWMFRLSSDEKKAMVGNALKTAECFSIKNSVDKIEKIYEALIDRPYSEKREEYKQWKAAIRLAAAEWDILKSMAVSVARTGEKR